MNGYIRDNSGQLSIIEILEIDGEPCDACGYTLTPTGDVVELVGWPDEGLAQVYLSDGGCEVLLVMGE